MPQLPFLLAPTGLFDSHFIHLFIRRRPVRCVQRNVPPLSLSTSETNADIGGYEKKRLKAEQSQEPMTGYATSVHFRCVTAATWPTAIEKETKHGHRR